MFISNRQCQLERDPNALGARRREFPRRDNYRDSNHVDFTKDIAKSFADRCKSRLTINMSNATLSKHLARRKWQLFTFTKIISRSKRIETILASISYRFALRSRLYDAPISSYRRSKFRRCNTAWRLYSTTTRDGWISKILDGRRPPFWKWFYC